MQIHVLPLSIQLWVTVYNYNMLIGTVPSPNTCAVVAVAAAGLAVCCTGASGAASSSSEQVLVAG